MAFGKGTRMGAALGLLAIVAAVAGPGGSAATLPDTGGSRGAGRLTALRVEPAAVALANGADSRRVLVSGRTPEGVWIDVTRSAQLRPETGVVRIDADGYIVPVKSGATRVEVSAGGAKVELPVRAAGAAAPKVSFVRDVMPILSKVGCNAGTCHGAAKGKNGFKLSLRGYDSDWDHYELTTAISGRRINRSDPAESLILLKPTEGVPHKGGMVLHPGARYYDTLLRWIAEGVKSDASTVKRADRLEVLPSSPALIGPRSQQQMLVVAHYPDGTTRDVTRDAVYTSGTADVATITPDGLVTAQRRGESPILVRYEGVYATDPLTVMGDRSGWRWAEEPANNFIDPLVDCKIRRVKSLPSPLCSDTEFMRRVSIDLTGLPPSPEQVRAFLSDPASSRAKRDRLIDRLLASREYSDHWTNKWADLLECNRKFLGEKGTWLFRDWIHRAISENMPYDRFVRAILTASGDAYRNPPANYYRVSRDPNTATENVTQLFMGVRFSCNKCHDHPFEHWTQSQYYQMGAFFTQVALKPGAEEGDEIVYDNPNGAPILNPRTGRIAAPIVPVGTCSVARTTRRQALANWLCTAENPFFAKSMANRVWSYFFGLGIIEPVDDIRSGNPPSNPELLDALTSRLVDSGFDVRALMRDIVGSRAYQRSIQTNRWNEDDAINFSHVLPRRLLAEELFDAVGVATGSQRQFAALPADFRACQLPDNSVDPGGFLDLFGRPPRESPCECERSSTMSLSQSMNLINGPTISDALADPKGRIARLAATRSDTRTLVRGIYLAALCRPPSPTELSRAALGFSGGGSRLSNAQDLMWALINSPAFLFNR